MTPDPTHLLSGARTAFPQYAAVFDALANLLSADSTGADLGPILAAAKAGQRILLSPGASYVLTGSPTINADGVALIGSGNTITVTPAPGASSGIIVRGDGCEFAGLNIVATGVAMRLYGTDPAKRTAPPVGTYIHDCSFDQTPAPKPSSATTPSAPAPTLDTAILLDTWADNVRISDCTFGLIGGQSIYCTADGLQVHNCTFAGSGGEHCVRFDLNGTTSHRPLNATLFACDMTNHNVLGKECLAARKIDGLHVINCTFDGWVSAGQENNDTSWHARNVIFFGCTWKTLRPGGALGQFGHDSTITLDSCSAPASVTEPTFTLGARGTLTAANNTLHPPTAGTCKPLAIVDPSAILVETATRLG